MFFTNEKKTAYSFQPFEAGEVLKRVLSLKLVLFFVMLFEKLVMRGSFSFLRLCYRPESTFLHFFGEGGVF